MLELPTQGARLEEDTSLEDRTSVEPVRHTPDYELHEAVISRSTEDRTDQLGIQHPTSDILASLVEPSREGPTRQEGSAEIQQQSHTGSLPAYTSSEGTIKEHVATPSVSESNQGRFSSIFTKATNALAASIPEPIKEVARSIDRKLSEVLPVWNDMKAWVSDAFENICDFFDELLSEEGTETNTSNSSSQSGTPSKTYVPKGDFDQSEFASVNNKDEQEQSKQELRKALQEFFYDILKDRKDAEKLLLNERLKEAINRMLTAVEDRSDKQEKKNTERQLKENNIAVDTHKEKQELIEKVAAERDINLNNLMNTFLREVTNDKTFRELEPFGFTKGEAEALIKAAVETAQTFDEEHTRPA